MIVGLGLDVCDIARMRKNLERHGGAFMDKVLTPMERAYCERRLEGTPYGTIEHDIEHFRPKKAVEQWPPARGAQAPRTVWRFRTGTAWADGYYLLAYPIMKLAGTPRSRSDSVPAPTA